MKKISDRMILTQLDAKIIASVKAHSGGLFVIHLCQDNPYAYRG